MRWPWPCSTSSCPSRPTASWCISALRLVESLGTWISTLRPRKPGTAGRQPGLTGSLARRRRNVTWKAEPGPEVDGVVRLSGAIHPVGSWVTATVIDSDGVDRRSSAAVIRSRPLDLDALALTGA